MQLIDRYLQAVKFALPKSQRDDIIQELQDSLLSQVEEREAALGRPLSEDEQVELLKKMGRPMQLASRYRDQQGLIGPTVLPIYWKVLKAALGLALLAQVIAGILTAAAGRPLSASLAPIFHYPSAALTVFAWVTLSFAGLHFFGGKIQCGEHWDPRKLPGIVKGERKKGRVESIASLVVGAIVAVWWLVGLRNPWLVFGPGAAFMTFAPVWLKLYPLFVVLGVAEVLRHTLELVRPYATQLHTIARLAIRTLSLLVLVSLFRARDVFVPVPPGNQQLQPLLAGINYSIRLGLLVAVIIMTAQYFVEAWKLVVQHFKPPHETALDS